ncbi:MAG TPA: hypothetical protein VGB44_07130 [Flavobacterium sp.]
MTADFSELIYLNRTEAEALVNVYHKLDEELLNNYFEACKIITSKSGLVRTGEREGAKHNGNFIISVQLERTAINFG